MTDPPIIYLYILRRNSLQIISSGAPFPDSLSLPLHRAFSLMYTPNLEMPSCTSLVLLLYFSCTSLALLLHFSCTSLALLLHFSCTSLALLLRFSCTSLVLLLYFSCISLVLLLYFSYYFKCRCARAGKARLALCLKHFLSDYFKHYTDAKKDVKVKLFENKIVQLNCILFTLTHVTAGYTIKPFYGFLFA